jgi:prephenate dehydrogenase
VKVGVAGLGLIGGSLLRALGGVGYDADPDVRAAVASEGFEATDSLEGLAGCELVFVAVPPAITYDVVREVLEAAPAALVADTASVKGAVPELDRFVSAHPMAGSEAAGWAASSGELLHGATWAACPSDRSLDPLLALAGAVDGPVYACSAADHDAAVARTSHVPHLVAHALAALAPDGVLAGTAFRDMTRVARADAGLWAAILTANHDAIEPALDELEAHLGELRSRLGDEATLRDAWGEPGTAAEPAWHEEAIGGWDELLALGTPVRRLRLDDGVLHAEVAR